MIGYNALDSVHAICSLVIAGIWMLVLRIVRERRGRRTCSQLYSDRELLTTGNLALSKRHSLRRRDLFATGRERN